MTNHAAAIRGDNPFSVSRRGRESIEFDLGGNRRRFVGITGKLHYGALSDLEIDDAWQPSVAPWDFEMVQNDWSVTALARFDAGQIILYTHQDGATLGLQPQQLQWTNDLDQIEAIADPQNVNAVSDDNMLEWTGAYGADLDFQWFCRHSGLSKYLVINNAVAIGSPPQFIIDGGNPVLRLQLIFQKSPTVEIFLNGQVWNEAANNPVDTAGTIDWRDSATGEVLWRFHLPAASNADQSEEGSETRNIIGNYRLRKTGPNLFVEVRIPWPWLESSAYPVLVDTNFTDQPDATGGQDTNTDGSVGDEDVNFGTNVELKARTGRRNILIKFDVSSIPSTATDDAADLSLWSNEVNTAKTWQIFSLHSNVSTWTELGATHNDYKSATNWPGSAGGNTSGTDYEADATPPDVVFPNNSTDTEEIVDLTSGVNLTTTRIAGWWAASPTNYGLTIGPTGDGSTRDFHSSDSASSTLRPQISIDYTEVGGQPTQKRTQGIPTGSGYRDRAGRWN